MSIPIEFGSRSAANDARDRFGEHLCPEDDSRVLKTVYFVSDTPEAVIEAAEAEAAEDKAADEQRSNTEPLTDKEREKIKDAGGFSKTVTTANWRSAKGTFATAGLTDVFRDAIGAVNDYEDPAEGAAAYVENYRESGGGGGGLDVGEEDVQRREKEANAAQVVQAEGCNHAEEECEHGDPAACEHLQQVCGYTSEEVSDLLGGDVRDGDDPEQTDLVTVGGGEYPEMDVTPETAGALRRSWQGYKGGLGGLREGIEQVEQAVIDARQSMRAINSIREAHGQDELHPDSLHDLLDSLGEMPGSIPEVRTLAHFADADAGPTPRDRDAAAEPVMSERSTLERMDQAGDLVEVRSPRRPLPRGARHGLRDFGLVEELDPDDSGRNGGALVLERPPAEFLDRWDLEVERSADLVYSHPQDDVLIYTNPDRVMVGATEATLTPEEAVRNAEEEDRFTLEEGDPEAFLAGTDPEPRDLDDSLTSAMSEGADLERRPTPERPANPRTGGDSPQDLRVGRRAWPLPAPWDGWDDLVTRSVHVEEEAGEGTYAAYLSEDRRTALVLHGGGGNKWAMTAYRYLDPMPEDPTGEQLQFGPNGQDTEGIERRKLTYGNTASAAAWSAFENNALTVDQVRHSVREPVTEEDAEDALDALVRGEWSVGLISEAFDVPNSVASAIEEMGDNVGAVLKVADNLDSFEEYPGIGETGARKVRGMIPELRSRGVRASWAMVGPPDQGGDPEPDPEPRNRTDALDNSTAARSVMAERDAPRYRRMDDPQPTSVDDSLSSQLLRSGTDNADGVGLGWNVHKRVLEAFPTAHHAADRAFLNDYPDGWLSEIDGIGKGRYQSLAELSLFHTENQIADCMDAYRTESPGIGYLWELNCRDGTRVSIDFDGTTGEYVVETEDAEGNIEVRRRTDSYVQAVENAKTVTFNELDPTTERVEMIEASEPSEAERTPRPEQSRLAPLYDGDDRTVATERTPSPRAVNEDADRIMSEGSDLERMATEAADRHADPYTVHLKSAEIQEGKRAARWGERNSRDLDRRRLRSIRGHLGDSGTGPVRMTRQDWQLLGDAAIDYLMDGIEGSAHTEGPIQAVMRKAEAAVENIDAAEAPPAPEPTERPTRRVSRRPGEQEIPAEARRVAERRAAVDTTPTPRTPRAGTESAMSRGSNLTRMDEQDLPAWDVETVRDTVLGDTEAARVAVMSWNGWEDWATSLAGSYHRNTALSSRMIPNRYADQFDQEEKRRFGSSMTPTAARRVLMIAGREDMAEALYQDRTDTADGDLIEGGQVGLDAMTPRSDTDPRRLSDDTRHVMRTPRPSERPERRPTPTDAMQRTNQQALTGGANSDQMQFGAAGSDPETEIESRPEKNEGGIMADTREETGDSPDTDNTEQVTPDAFQVAEGGQGTLGDVSTDTDADPLQDAINALEAESDGYGDRVSLDADMKRHLGDAGLDTEAWTERTSQDVFRYGIAAEDVMDRMELPNDADPEEYRAAIIDFAAEEDGMDFSDGGGTTSAYPEPVPVSADPDTPPTMYYVKGQTGPNPWLNGEHVLISAGVAWRNSGPGFNLPAPEDPDTLMIDSGGFQATVHFGDEYPYSPRELFEWAEEVGADYVCGMDWACESAEAIAEVYDDVEPSEIAPVAERIERTIDKQREQVEVYQDGNWSFDLVPVVQGLEPSDYRYCARRLREAGVAREYMGIGTVCKRESVDGILDVVGVCEDELPATEWHLFGATKSVWKDRRFWGRFASADTHAWAMKNDDGTWTQTAEDKRNAFESYKDDIEAERERMVSQDSLDSFEADRSQFAAMLDAGIGCRECLCGTEIPAYGTDFEPKCRHCESTKLNRGLRNMNETNTARDPAETHEQDAEQETLR